MQNEIYDINRETESARALQAYWKDKDNNMLEYYKGVERGLAIALNLLTKKGSDYDKEL